MSLRLLPDLEQLLIGALNSEVAAMLPGEVHNEFPRNYVLPLAVLTRAGGEGMVPPWLDRARVQVDAYGTTWEQARDAAALMLAALHDLPGTYELGIVTAVRDENVMQHSPDPPTGLPRYVSIVSVWVHPASAGS